MPKKKTAEKGNDWYRGEYVAFGSSKTNATERVKKQQNKVAGNLLLTTPVRATNRKVNSISSRGVGRVTPKRPRISR